MQVNCWDTGAVCRSLIHGSRGWHSNRKWWGRWNWTEFSQDLQQWFSKCGPQKAASVPPGNLLKLQMLRSHTRLLGQKCPTPNPCDSFPICHSNVLPWYRESGWKLLGWDGGLGLGPSQWWTEDSLERQPDKGGALKAAAWKWLPGPHLIHQSAHTLWIQSSSI